MNLEGKKIYLASGWFNENQERRLKKAEEVLREMGFEVFSPREHQFLEYSYNSQPWRDVVFENDVDNVHKADFIFAIYDETDSGTMFEIGLAYALGKPIFIFHEAEEYCNLMISESLNAYFKSWDQVKHYDWKTCPVIRYEGTVE
ncbi:nucleoside 2-deoxyribosyltransferase [Priestia filamentosa]|uniref:nucleoside 2-deoxyribosyltransferase n=1 Tax=Priestia filamentosa TaxID=1402861 RepID=UPI003982BC90